MNPVRTLTAPSDGTLTCFETSTVHTRVPSLTYTNRCKESTRKKRAVRSAKAKLAVVQRKISELTAYGKAEHEF